MTLAPGQQFYAIKSGTIFRTSLDFAGASHITRRGETYTVTPAMLEANTDRLGNCWLSLIDDDDAQIERWGEVRFGLGHAPDDLTPWDPDNAGDMDEERERRRKAAWALPTDQEQREALSALRREMGYEQTSRTIQRVKERR